MFGLVADIMIVKYLSIVWHLYNWDCYDEKN